MNNWIGETENCKMKSAVTGGSFIRKLYIVPKSALVDEVVSVKVIGLVPSQPVTLLATVEDNGKRFYSTAWYTSDSLGIVDVTTMPSAGGTYVSLHC